MRTAALLSERAEAAAARHRLLIAAFHGLYDRAVARPDTLTERARDWLGSELYAVARAHLDGERHLLEAELAQSASDARRDALAHLGIADSATTPAALSEALSASLTHAAREIATQIERDITQTLRAHRALALRVAIHGAATGWSEGASLTRARLEDDRPRHWFQDRAGRRWPSQKFVRALWRQSLLGGYVDAYALTLAEAGETRLRVWHPDPRHRFRGMIVHLDGEGQGLEAVRDEVFHPNAEALPRAVRFDEENEA